MTAHAQAHLRLTPQHVVNVEFTCCETHAIKKLDVFHEKKSVCACACLVLCFFTACVRLSFLEIACMQFYCRALMFPPTLTVDALKHAQRSTSHHVMTCQGDGKHATNI